MRAIVSVLALWPSLVGAQSSIELPEAIRRAKAHNPVVLAARAELDAARHGIRTARSLGAPRVAANGFLASSKPGGQLRAGPGSMEEAAMAVPPGDTMVANLMLMVPLYTGGVTAARLASASAEERAALAELVEAEAEATLAVEEAFLAVLLAKRMEEVWRARASAAEELRRTTQARFDAGKEIRASVQRATAELADANRRLTTATSERRKALIELQAAVGDGFAEAFEVAGDLPSAQPISSLSWYIESAKTRRGRVLAALAAREATDGEIRAARGSLGPQIYAQVMGDASNRPMMRGGTLGLTLSVPILDGGERRAELARAHAMRARADARVAAERIAAEKEVRTAWLDLEVADANAKSAESSVASAAEALETVRLRVEAGKAILLDELDAITVLTEARSELARSTYERSLALARLNRASGLLGGHS